MIKYDSVYKVHPLYCRYNKGTGPCTVLYVHIISKKIYFERTWSKVLQFRQIVCNFDSKHFFPILINIFFIFSLWLKFGPQFNYRYTSIPFRHFGMYWGLRAADSTYLKNAGFIAGLIKCFIFSSPHLWNLSFFLKYLPYLFKIVFFNLLYTIVL